MAEYCIDCWNELNGTDDPPEKYVLSITKDICEGCGEYKHVIVDTAGKLVFLTTIVRAICRLIKYIIKRC